MKYIFSILYKCLAAVIFTAILWLAPASLYAQVKFQTVVTDGQLYTGQAFQVQYTIDGSARVQQLQIPEFRDFQLREVFDVSNRSTNGSVTRETYSKVAVLTAKYPGKFVVPGATAIIDGKLARSNAVKVVVRKNRQPTAPVDDPFDSYNRVEDESEIRQGETIEQKIKENFFLRAEVSKTDCVVGEPIMATFKAYSRLNATSQVVKRPSLTGFSVLEMVDGYNNQPSIEKVNGKLFYVHLIRKVQLFPLQPGTFQLDGAEVESTIHFTRPDPEDRGFNGLRNLFRRKPKKTIEPDENLEHQVNLVTPPVSIHVKPLSEAGMPKDFSGAVGKFTVNLKVPDKKVHQQEPMTVKLVLTGTGNFPLITDPQVKWPAGVEVSEPVVSEEVNKYAFPLSGTKIFEYTLETKDTGSYMIEPLQFSYFDPAANSYKTEQTEPVAYTVTRDKNKTNAAGTDGEKIIRDIQPGLPLQWYWFGGIAFIIAGWIIYQVFNKRGTKNKNTEANPEENQKFPEDKGYLESKKLWENKENSGNRFIGERNNPNNGPGMERNTAEDKNMIGGNNSFTGSDNLLRANNREDNPATVAGKMDKPVTDPAVDSNLKMQEMTRDNLASVYSAFIKDDKKSFYSGIRQTILETIATKYNVAYSSLTKDQILQLLRGDDLPVEISEKLLSLLNECEWALYTPGQTRDMEEAYYILESTLQILINPAAE